MYQDEPLPRQQKRGGGFLLRPLIWLLLCRVPLMKSAAAVSEGDLTTARCAVSVSTFRHRAKQAPP